MNIIAWFVVGGLIGWLASVTMELTRSRESFSTSQLELWAVVLLALVNLTRRGAARS